MIDYLSAHRAATEEALARSAWEYVEALEELVRMAREIDDIEAGALKGPTT